jgi:hypothetical protein
MSGAYDYLATFGIDPRRVRRGMVLADIVNMSLGEIPRFRDGWVERGQNPDAAPGVGPLIIAFYTESNGIFRDGMASKIFGIRSNPLYREERDDLIADGFTTFYFNVPAGLPDETVHSLARAAVEKVDTDARWVNALGLGMTLGPLLRLVNDDPTPEGSPS